ncbi:hypothetical protein GCM10029992_54460 [Glycomyces albus]
MCGWLSDALVDHPEIALFLVLGTARIWKTSLGGAAGTLMVAIFVGMITGIELDDQVTNIAFALFIFTLGYISGPNGR